MIGRVAGEGRSEARYEPHLVSPCPRLLLLRAEATFRAASRRRQSAPRTPAALGRNYVGAELTSVGTIIVDGLKGLHGAAALDYNVSHQSAESGMVGSSRCLLRAHVVVGQVRLLCHS